MTRIVHIPHSQSVVEGVGTTGIPVAVVEVAGVGKLHTADSCRRS